MREPNNLNQQTVIIGLGSNIEPEKNIIAAIKLLDDYTDVEARGSIWKSAAVGSEGPDYLNTVVCIKTELPPRQLKSNVLAKIEKLLGRVRTADKYADRTIDLDILIYKNEIVDPELWTQPHITIPAAEIIPDFLHPETKIPLSQVANDMLLGAAIIKLSDSSLIKPD